jgi:hypothetical protein
VGRLAQLTVSLYNWTEEQKIEAKFDMDKVTTEACPDVRADVLKFIGTDSFANSF